MPAPEFPRPAVGDSLVVVRSATRYRERTVTPVVVTGVARFRVDVVAAPGGEPLPQDWTEFDLRTQGCWRTRNSDAPTSNHSVRLHTAETLAYADRKAQADGYLTDSGVHVFQLRGTLEHAARKDPMALANALRVFEGLDPL